MAAILHVGDVGAVLRVTLLDADSHVIDVSSATTLELLLEKPDGSNLARTASFTNDGTDGKIQYVTQTGVLDQAGTWRLQAHVVTSTWESHSDVEKFKVKENIA